MVDPRTLSELISEKDGIINLLPETMEEVTRLDAQYHASVRDQWVDLNQIATERNERFHDDVIHELARDLARDAVILELGSGVGYDARRFLELNVPFGCYIVSEISPGLLELSRKTLSPLSVGKQVLYCCLDANRILIADGQVDRVFTIAALHHFPHLHDALVEIDRITKRGAKIIFAIEPNRLWSSVLVALKPFYRRLFSNKLHSAADEEAEGFTFKDLASIGSDFRWTVQRITPIWFFTGALHNGLEFTFRLLRLRRRLRVPIFIEKLFLCADSIFFKIPFCNRLAWHYTVVLRK
jgi:ubiquinone/menaquinone biosynthesis C-methylase UbiE